MQPRSGVKREDSGTNHRRSKVGNVKAASGAMIDLCSSGKCLLPIRPTGRLMGAEQVGVASNLDYLPDFRGVLVREQRKRI
ncbi:hypothetical protein [Dokdonella sp.]|uniref:hypothetical protein n=1 Tax=Dokdonella sp. TaxID=2291710 RepID=UPI0035274772